MLTIADGLIVLVIFLSTVISWFRGFVREVLSLLAWISAFFVAFSFSHAFGNVFSNASLQDPISNNNPPISSFRNA